MADDVTKSANSDSHSKKNKRKQKTKSLIVLTKSNESNHLPADNKLSLSAECDQSTFGLRSRFSFRRGMKFGRGRSSSKSSLPDSKSNSNSITSIDGASNANSLTPPPPPPPPCDRHMKCPIITYNDNNTPQLSQQIGSK